MRKHPLSALKFLPGTLHFLRWRVNMLASSLHIKSFHVSNYLFVPQLQVFTILLYKTVEMVNLKKVKFSRYNFKQLLLLHQKTMIGVGIYIITVLLFLTINFYHTVLLRKVYTYLFRSFITTAAKKHQVYMWLALWKLKRLELNVLSKRIVLKVRLKKLTTALRGGVVQCVAKIQQNGWWYKTT